MGNSVTSGYATTKPLTLDIDLNNITKGVSDIKALEHAILRGIELGEREVAIRLKEKMIEYLTEYGLGDSLIAQNITITPLGKGIQIMADTDYAVYVEYGTGVVGSENPHPHPWEYDVNGHGDKGWFYPTTEEDPNPRKHTYNGQLYGWTKGQASRPFMYRTWLWGTQSSYQIIMKNLNAEIRKIQGVR